MASSSLDTDTRVKKPGTDVKLTPLQKEEWERCAYDYYYFARNYVYVQSDAGSVLFDPRSYQKDMIDEFFSNQFTIYNAPRQCGKTATFVTVILWYICFFEDMDIGVTSYKGTAVKDIMKRVRYSYEHLPFWMKPAARSYAITKMMFDNDTTIEAETTSENTFRGRSMSLLLIDEFSHVRSHVAEEFWTSMLPTVTGGGEDSNTKIAIISTPNGSEGVYARLWFGAVDNENGFGYYAVDPDDIPGRGPNFKKNMLSKMTENKFLQEYMGHFISSKPLLVDSKVIESIKPVAPVNETDESDDLHVFVHNFYGREVAVVCDPSEGVGLDYHAIQIFDVNTLEQLAEYRNNQKNQTMLTMDIIRILEWLEEMGVRETFYTVEANSIGIGILNLLVNSDRTVLRNAQLINDFNKPYDGIKTTNQSKKRCCGKFKDLVELRKMTLRSRRLLSELRFFIKKGASFSAETGKNDDLVMACVLFVRVLEELACIDEDVDRTMNDIRVSSDEAEDPLPILL